jgi:sporulation protein YlmC with PRC-barrel domain
VQRATQLMGRAIVSADRGRRLGTVSDVLLDEERNRIVGLVVRSGWLKRERVLPYAAVQAVGRDAIIARSEEALIGPKTWHDRASDVESRTR